MYYALNEFFDAPETNAFKTMKMIAARYDQYDVTPLIVTNLTQFAAYNRSLSKRWILGVKPWGDWRATTDALVSVMAPPAPGLPPAYARSALFIEAETNLSNTWADNGRLFPDIAYFLQRVRATGWTGELWWYPFLHSVRDNPATQPNEALIRTLGVSSLARFIAAFDPASRFVDIQLARPSELPNQTYQADGRLHSGWYRSEEQVRDWLGRRPLSIAYPHEGFPSGSYWPETRLPEVFAYARQNDRDLIFDPGASHWADYPDKLGQWLAA